MKPTYLYLSLGTAIIAIAMILTTPTTSFACSLNPTANITSPVSFGGYYIGDPVLFDGTTSTENCGIMTSYTWYVRPNGFVGWTQVSTGSSYNHVFLSTGNSWQVRLTVTNSVGKSHTRILTGIKVENQPSSQYYLTDHLGSVRVVVDEAGGLIGWDDYYPFGLVMPQRSGNNTVDHDLYKFTSYELEQQGDLGLYHAEARMFDPQIGRFLSVDPWAFAFPGWSPYVYVFNNPIAFTDPTGLFPVGSDRERENFSFVISDYVYDPGTGKYHYDKDVTGPENTPAGLVYVGPKRRDVREHHEINMYNNHRGGFPDRGPQFDHSRNNLEPMQEMTIEHLSWFRGSGGGPGFWKLLLARLGIGSRAAQGVTNLIPEGKLANHLFKGAGKLVDNPANRTLIQNISNGKPLVVDKFGKSWYRGVDAAGNGIYSYTQNGVVKGAGYTNLSAAEIIAKYGVK